MKLTVKVPGSCGELVQGTREGVPFLVTCPVNLYTTVTVTDENMAHRGLGAKAEKALERTLHYLGETSFPYGITLSSELPIGKGMASSSADIAAVCYAVAAVFGHEITAPEVSRIAAGIEPTDGIFFDGVVRLNHMTGECYEALGVLPRIQIAIFDTGGAVDTLDFHQRKDLGELSEKNERQTDAALALLSEPRTAASIAAAATKSAVANQSILHKAKLKEIIEEARALGALGINVAHSGTILGVLFSPDRKKLFVEKQAAVLQQKFPHLTFLQSAELISGGADIEKG